MGIDVALNDIKKLTPRYNVRGGGGFPIHPCPTAPQAPHGPAAAWAPPAELQQQSLRAVTVAAGGWQQGSGWASLGDAEQSQWELPRAPEDKIQRRGERKKLRVSLPLCSHHSALQKGVWS